MSSYYAHPLVYLFFGGFIIARALEETNLHYRIAALDFTPDRHG